MTVTLFISILVAGAAVSTLLTQAIKKWYYNLNKEASPNLIALIDGLIIGIGGVAVSYMLLGIEWTINNIICMILMGFCVWLASMLGYDKVIELVKQLSEPLETIKKSAKTEEKDDNDEYIQ